MMVLGILASHRGTNFQAIIDACQCGRLKARPGVAISNNSAAVALERAQAAGIPTAHLSSRTHPDPDDLDAAILETLQQHNVDIVVTVGYMKKLGPRTLAAYANRIINIHPSLLPKYGGKGMYGMNVHRAVIDAGDSETGISIHRLDADYDTGPVIAQCRIPVHPDDTPESLAERVLEREHEFLVETLDAFIEELEP